VPDPESSCVLFFSLSATITWGDGNTSPATLVPLGGGSYSVQGSNTYEDEADYTGTVQISDQSGASANLGFAANVGSNIVFDVPASESIIASAGGSFSGEVAAFYDENPANTSSAAGLSATIDWGDGNTSTATLVPLGAGGFSVRGSDTYAAAGSYAGTVQVSDQAGDSATLNFSASVTGGEGSDLARVIHADTAGDPISLYVSSTPGGSEDYLDADDAGPFDQNLFTSVIPKKHPGPTRRVVVHMTAGTYTVSTTLLATDADSYTTLDAPTGTTLSGGVSVDNWTAATGDAGVYSAQIPAGIGGAFRDLYVDGTREIQAQDPEFSPTDASETFGTGLNTNQIWQKNTTSDPGFPAPEDVLIPKGGYPDLPAYISYGADQSGTEYASGNPVEYVELEGYDEVQMPIASITSVTSQGATSPTATDNNYWELTLSNIMDAHPAPQQYLDGNPYYLENYAPTNTSGLPMLQPGEWYEDLADDLIYYMPTSSQGSTFSAVVPRAISEATTPTAPANGAWQTMNTADGAPLLQIGLPTTSYRNAISGFVVNGLTFSYSSWLAPSHEGYIGEQMGVFNVERPGTVPEDPASGSATLDSSYSTQIPALAVGNADGTTIENCHFTHLGGAGLGLVCQTQNSQVVDNHFSDISGNGIIVNCVQALQDLSYVNTSLGLGPYSSIADFVSKDDTIAANNITDVGVDFPDSAAILAAFCDNLTIGGTAGGVGRPNVIYQVPSAAIADGRSANSYNGEPAAWGSAIPKKGAAGDGTWSQANITHNQIGNYGNTIVGDVTTVTNDTGGIYVDGCNWDFNNSTGTQVSENYINGVEPQNPSVEFVSSTSARYGIYDDSGANGVSVVDNHLYNVQGQDVLFHDDTTNWGHDGAFQWGPILPSTANHEVGGLIYATKGKATDLRELASGNTLNGVSDNGT